MKRLRPQPPQANESRAGLTKRCGVGCESSCGIDMCRSLRSVRFQRPFQLSHKRKARHRNRNKTQSLEMEKTQRQAQGQNRRGRGQKGSTAKRRSRPAKRYRTRQFSTWCSRSRFFRPMAFPGGRFTPNAVAKAKKFIHGNVFSC